MKASLYTSITKVHESAVLIKLGSTLNQETHAKAKAVTSLLEASHFEWLIEVVPSYTCVMVYVNPLMVVLESPLDFIIQEIKRCLQGKLSQQAKGGLVKIPVVYGGESGPDLITLAEYHKLTPAEVISLHSDRIYTVYMIGFTPGFPYLGELDQRLVTPRRDQPRLKIAPGSVAIGGAQTGIYPIESPGGWHIIGRTPITLFHSERNPVTLLQVGNHVQFVPIDESQIWLYEEGEYDY
ncbi:5-oxoprolinase subunit PxpB [Alkalihalobacillus hemicellulosilyticus]|uniref:Allophanate hydrolase 2 subunit 1 n=1 Tax=Halalkalibacter hemicellulosilyticusJCM 9152 TaxID=1236971 RepID=W4QA48_9BACI|nr:5-oxoprolinase subunit PxpB [Halalkalibacter hemicellulosilyticus]GAE28885.1 allophanate hydrolase 2 subunit 1 [Halalkalibacter hemicellulosilyticusJCM 9152]